MYCVVGTTIDTASRSSASPSVLYAAREYSDPPLTTAVTQSIVKEKKWIAYPNPAADFIQFTGPVSGTYEILDVQGRIVSSSILKSDQKIDVSNLSNGVYTLRFTQQTACLRVIIAR